MSRQERFRAPGERDDPDGEPFQREDQRVQFIGFTGIAEGTHDIAVVHHPQVAVQGVAAETGPA